MNDKMAVEIGGPVVGIGVGGIERPIVTWVSELPDNEWPESAIAYRCITENGGGVLQHVIRHNGEWIVLWSMNEEEQRLYRATLRCTTCS